MNIIIFGAGGFIGTNLALKLAEDKKNIITLVGKSRRHFDLCKYKAYENVRIVEMKFNERTDFDGLLNQQDVVFHLVSSIMPSTSNLNIAQEIVTDIVATSKLLDGCVKNLVKKVIFISSGGTVYGKEVSCPIKEDSDTNPINTYGLQKLQIEKMLYMYKHMYGLNYVVLRVSNPYGPYQRPNGKLGAVTTFINQAIQNQVITVYGDGSVIRDYIYISDVVNAVCRLMEVPSRYSVYNIGSGKGISINQLLEMIKRTLDVELNVEFKESRKVDVLENYLDISRYESEFGRLCDISLEKGIISTSMYLKEMSYGGSNS